MYLGISCLLFWFVCLGYFLWAQKMMFRKEDAFFLEIRQQKRHIQRFFSAGVYILLHSCREKLAIRLKGDKLEQRKRIYIGKTEQAIFYEYYGKIGEKLSAVLLMGLLLVATVSVVGQKSELLQGYLLEKEDVMGAQRSIDLEVRANGTKKTISVEIPQRVYSREELEKEFQKAEKYIDQSYLGNNISPDKVQKPLCLVKSIPESALSVEWDVGEEELVCQDGTLENQELEEKCQTQLVAVLSYGNEEKRLVKEITVLPAYRSKEDRFWQKWLKQLEKNKKKSASQKYLTLPQKVGDQKISYEEKQVQTGYMLLGGLLLLLLVIPMLEEEKTRREILRREEELRMSYPDFVEHFVLLLGAGLSMKGTWERMVQEYQKQKESSGKQYVYEEMKISLWEMEHGMGEARAYELFGKRTGLLQYMKFCTLMVQNLKKGSDDLLRLLDYEVEEAFRERKENAKAMGEKAGTKLLLPMMLMLSIVFALILYSAFQGM